MTCPLTVVEAAPPAQAATLHPGYWMWAAIGLAVLVFEIWAVATGHHTMSQSVQRGPLWFRWLVGAGLVGLFVHLFVWKR